MSLLHPNLIAFLKIVEFKTVQDAARSINLTQTAVTQRIRALEKELNQTLFTRSRKGMILTQDGENLLRYCQKIGDIEGQYLIESSTQNRVINISGPSTILRSRAIPRLVPLIKKYPHLRINFDFQNIDSSIQKLKKGESHFAIAPATQVGLEMDSKLLPAEKYILAASSKWKSKKIEDIIQNKILIDFDINDNYSIDIIKKAKLLHQFQNQRMYINNIDGLINAVELGAGYSALNLELIQNQLNRGTLLNLLPKFSFEINDLALAWYPRPEMPDYFQEIISILLSK